MAPDPFKEDLNDTDPDPDPFKEDLNDTDPYPEDLNKPDLDYQH